MNSKKKKMIQPRPVPPDLESIRKDLENAPRDDVAFTFFNVASNDADSPSTESERVVADLDKNSDALKTSIHSAAAESSSSSSATSSSSKKHSADLDKCYSQTLKFIEMNHYLKDSQERLADQCNELQELGKSVAEQVDMLRVQLS
ncbi:uncharacterized protein LOC117296024 [Asterias rubens]|uniref:uncharacterized protein LOC117296024 n=1 Tax=Asterias rubens TaxID=7604 RepID=UPI0014553547|nr:uncharacterized protein LOC117296024 [Asterias rubens]